MVSSSSYGPSAIIRTVRPPFTRVSLFSSLRSGVLTEVASGSAYELIKAQAIS